MFSKSLTLFLAPFVHRKHIYYVIVERKPHAIDYILWPSYQSLW